MSVYQVEEVGTPNATDYKVYFKQNNNVISPFHDIPLYHDKGKNIFNMVVEIPRWTNAKMEIATKDPMNPIKQDIKKGALRFVANCFPHKGYIWNYGALPQTWENPNVVDDNTKCKGDNDPIDVIEIGFRVAKRGEVVPVKVLGTIALIDEGETDWKIFAIDAKDPLADKINDIDDIDKYFPGLMKATLEWFKIYKIPDGKPENQFAFSGEAKNKEFALKVIQEVNHHWKELVLKKTDARELSCMNVLVGDSPYKVDQAKADSILKNEPPLKPAQPIDASVDKWHFITLK